MNNVTSMESYLKQKQELESEKEKLELAKKNGYNTYEDYVYSTAKEYSVNPNFSLNKEYYNLVQEYLVNTLNNFLDYKKNNLGEGKEITIYSLNEVINEIFKGNEVLTNILDSEGLSTKDFLQLLYTTNLEKVSEYQLGIRKGM